MGKYGSFKREVYKRPYDVHPIWRGIGCFMMILIPLMAIVGSMVTIDEGTKAGWPIPQEFLGYPRLPALAYQLPVIDIIALTISSVNNLYGIIVISLVFMVLGFAIISMVYSFAFRVTGPPRYTPLDAPEVPRGKRYKR
jgi:hypothetical protein